MLSIGDIVQLKSGSPPMTVAKVDKLYNRVDLIWFCSGKIRRGSSPAEGLVKNTRTQG